MDEFITWGMLATFTTLASIVFMVTEFTKDLKWVVWIETKYYSWFVALFLIVVSNFVLGSFVLMDIILYMLSAVSISLTANGLFDFNKMVITKKNENQIK